MTMIDYKLLILEKICKQFKFLLREIWKNKLIFLQNRILATENPTIILEDYLII